MSGMTNQAFEAIKKRADDFTDTQIAELIKAWLKEQPQWKRSGFHYALDKALLNLKPETD